MALTVSISDSLVDKLAFTICGIALAFCATALPKSFTFSLIGLIIDDLALVIGLSSLVAESSFTGIAISGLNSSANFSLSIASLLATCSLRVYLESVSLRPAPTSCFSLIYCLDSLVSPLINSGSVK